MASRKFRPCSGCDSPSVSRPEKKCYEERHLVHIITDFLMGTPVILTLIDSKDTKRTGYYLDFNRSTRTVHFQPAGDTTVNEIPLSEICTMKYRT
ncbi:MULTISPECIES: hypothetical protein [Sporosarcina]|uniref:hypothetical protein n=1 Tax=Sporosarcina TaxID=1569 RepID=UPI00129B448A|nr:MULTISPECIES: hypothetical protein [Sporosarcina]GKV66126.1 hypothetical protein NCCP2331_22790 [Sporosarcina sp. NCCP-2331]GLB56116.1 hypothetical protein NCCP2378_19030 [Sporosarcina sp. NCCP-2378]